MVTTKATTASDGEAQLTAYKYPDEALAGGMTGPYQDMIDRNMIAPVVQQAYYKNSTLQQAVRTNYGTFTSSLNVFEPLNIQTQTSGGFDTRVEFTAIMQTAVYYRKPRLTGRIPLIYGGITTSTYSRGKKRQPGRGVFSKL